MKRAWLVLLLGCGAPGGEVEVACDATCPEGTRRGELNSSGLGESTLEGGFLYTEAACEAWCEPIQACLPPNVPVVDDAGYRCEPLPGFTTLEPDDEVDLSWGASWAP